MTERTFTFRFPSAEHFVTFFRLWYGPTLKAFAALEGAARDALERDLVALSAARPARHATPSRPRDLHGSGRDQALRNSAARILLIAGSLRERSTNAAVVRTAAALALPELDAVVFDGLGRLPHFNPDDDFAPLPAAVDDLRAGIAGAAGVLFCTPEYAGALPGSFKNLLDWTIGGEELYRKPVGWINAAAEGRGNNAHDSLRKVLGFAHATIVEPACVRSRSPATPWVTTG